MAKYPESIMQDLRQREGLKPDDTSKDDEIESMSKSDVLNEVATWNGLIGYGDTILDWIEDIYGVDLREQEDKLKQANKNIESLINIIVQSKIESKNGYCYFPAERYDKKWDCDELKCSDCRGKYYNNIKAELYNEYIIK